MIPVYVSLTSIYSNQEILAATLQSIIRQTQKPCKIYLYLSEDPYILDDGFEERKLTNTNLLKIINDNSIIEIKWVKNMGSYRKLLPLLKDKWLEDCIIITIDDDTIYAPDLIKNLVQDCQRENCVINYRGFTPKLNNLVDFDYSQRDNTRERLLINFATGKGGILYKPQFFHKTGDLIFRENIYTETCDKQDDVWFYIIRIMNGVDCYLGSKPWALRDISSRGLWAHYNGRYGGMPNSMAVRNTLAKLKETVLKYYKFNYDDKVIYFNFVPGDHISHSWKNGQFYEQKLLEKIRSLNLVGVYVDVGSHHGNHSVYFDKFCDSEKVISIEGNPFNFEFLKRNIDGNNCQNILYNKIVDANEGVNLTMEYNLQNTGSSMVIVTEGPSLENCKRITNTTDTIDNLLKNEDKICLIKMDIENYEYKAMLGAREIIEKYHPVIVIELHKNNPYYKEIVDFLDKNNYKTDNINYACSPTFIYIHNTLL